jgi:membrane-associated phospholipid phosphatase
VVASGKGKLVTAFRASWRSSPLTRVFAQCLLLTAVMIGAGFFVTNFLAHRWPLSLEDNLVHAMVAARTPTLDRISNDVSLVAYTSGLAIVAIAAGCAMRIAFRRWREFFFLAAAMLAEVEVFMVTALTVARARPPVPELDDFPPMESFPSGHVSAAVALYGGIATILAMRARRTSHAIAWWALLLVVPVAVAISRVYRGMHHPSDVVASYIVGFGCLFILRRAMLVPAQPEAMRAA